MQARTMFAIGCLLTAAACGDVATEGEPRVTEDDVGTLQLSLTGVDADNQLYRLRAATLVVSGTSYHDGQAVYVELSSEDGLDDELLSARLMQGYYSVSLVSPPQWYIERITAEGTERVQQAVLLSQPTQYTVIQPGGVSQVGFQFGVDGDLIDFFGGRLDIGIGIQRAQPVAGATGG